MKAVDWIEKVKTLRAIESDYGVAKEIGLSRQAVSGYRKKTPTMDEDSAIKVAKAIGERPAAVVLDQFAESIKDPDLQQQIRQIARQLCILC